MDIYRLICRQGPCSKFGQISFGCPGFRGFSPLFRRRLPLFSRGRCMRRQATTWHGRKFSWGGKKAAFNLLMWVLPNLISSLFLDPTIWSLLLSNFNLMFQHDVVGVGRVYWFLAAVVFSCMPFSDVCSFLKVVFVGLSVRWKLAPHLWLPRPCARSTLQRWNPHKIDNHLPPLHWCSRFYCTLGKRYLCLTIHCSPLHYWDPHKGDKRDWKKAAGSKVMKWKNKR